MKNIYGFTNPHLLDRMDTLKDGPESEHRLMNWLKQQKETQVCPGVFTIAYEDGTYGFRTEPKGLLDRLPMPLTDFLYEWTFHYGMSIDDSEEEENQGSALDCFYGE